tara:strand:+ start:278 stop:706 length:429 start_codon:yes stop_codon:yes gene_type:complete
MLFLNNYFKKIKDILLYYDYQPLLLFWITSDVFNNMVLWTNYSYWLELGQPNTYFLYLTYLIISLGILLSLHNLRRLILFISCYLIVYIYSTVRYLLDIYNAVDIDFGIMDFKNIFITAWYFSMWAWILFKLKKENLHRNER